MSAVAILTFEELQLQQGLLSYLFIQCDLHLEDDTGPGLHFALNQLRCANESYNDEPSWLRLPYQDHLQGYLISNVSEHQPGLVLARLLVTDWFNPSLRQPILSRKCKGMVAIRDKNGKATGGYQVR